MKSLFNLLALVVGLGIFGTLAPQELFAQQPGTISQSPPFAGQVESTNEKPADDDSADDQAQGEGESQHSPDQQDTTKDQDEDQNEEKAAAKSDAENAKDEHDEQDAGEKQAAKKKKNAKSAKKKAKTHKVTADRFRIQVEMDGIFAAEQMEEIALRPEAWSTFKIEQVVDHGSQVHEGQVLLEFDDQKLKDTIAALELELHLGELSIRRAEQEMPRIEKGLQMAVDEAERDDRQAKQDYERFQNLEQAFYEKMADFRVKGSEYNLADAVEELEQLEKMYAADDLTEETEEIVLKRQRNTVEMAEFRVEDSEYYRDGILQVTLPRMEIRMQNALETAKLRLERARMAKSLDMNRARYELEKKKTLQDKARERHAKLLSDQALMQIESPIDGIVYFGRCVHGRWVDMTSMINKLRPYGSASSSSVLMTIVKPKPLYITALIDEEDRPSLDVDQPAKVVPPPEGSDKLPAKISSVSIAPINSTKFGVDLSLDEAELPDWIVPGMTCEIKVTTYDKEDALVVPKAGVQADEDNEDEEFVWLIDPEDADSEPRQQTVQTGKRGDEGVEIVSGLSAGDVISLEDHADENEGD